MKKKFSKGLWRQSLIVLALGTIVLAGCAKGVSNEPGNTSEPSVENRWDTMKWDEGKWE